MALAWSRRVSRVTALLASTLIANVLLASTFLAIVLGGTAAAVAPASSAPVGFWPLQRVAAWFLLAVLGPGPALVRRRLRR